MLGHLFTISPTNIGHAAIRSAPIAVGAPAEARLVSLSGDPFWGLGVLVTGDHGFRREITIDDERVRGCLESEGIQQTERYVDDLAAEIRSAVAEALRA